MKGARQKVNEFEAVFTKFDVCAFRHSWNMEMCFALHFASMANSMLVYGKLHYSHWNVMLFNPILPLSCTQVQLRWAIQMYVCIVYNIHVCTFWLFGVVLNIWLHTHTRIRNTHIIHSQQMNVFMSQLILSDSAPYCFHFVKYGLIAIFAFDLRLLF